MVPNVITYSALISACEKGGATGRATAAQIVDQGGGGGLVVWWCQVCVCLVSGVVCVCVLLIEESKFLQYSGDIRTKAQQKSTDTVDIF